MGTFWGIFWLTALVLAFVVAGIAAARRQRRQVNDPDEHYRRTGRVPGVRNLGSAPPATHHRMGRN